MTSVSTPASSLSRAKYLARTAMATAMRSIYSGDQDVDLFARVEGALDRCSCPLRGAIPERHEHVARVHKALVACSRLACVGQFLERCGHHVDGDPLVARRL